MNEAVALSAYDITAVIFAGAFLLVVVSQMALDLLGGVLDLTGSTPADSANESDAADLEQ